MHSAKATILRLNDRVIMVRIRQIQDQELIGKEVKINGLKTAGVHTVPSKEGEKDTMDFTYVLVYRIAENEDLSSLQIGSTCEVTWE